MVPRIKKLFIILSLLCFSVGCVQVKHVVNDVKQSIAGEKEAPPKTPPAESKETKPPPAPAKKGTPKKTQPPPGKSSDPNKFAGYLNK